MAAAAILLVSVLGMLVGGCGQGAARGAPGEPAPHVELVQGQSGGRQSDEQTLTSDDLFSIYQAAVTGAVSQVTESQLILGALNGAHSAAVDAGLPPVESAILDTAPISRTGDPSTDWNSFANAYDTLTKKLSDRVDIAPVGRGAARGMLSVLDDPLSTYLDASQVAAMQSTADAGIGVSLSPSDAGPLVREVQSDGPADQAGIHPGDVVRAVNGRDTGGMELYDVLAALRGAAGQQVTLSVVSPGDAPRDVSVRRARGGLPAASASVSDDVQVITLRAFQSGATQAVGRALVQSAASGASGWLIDIRGNGEGSLTEAVGLTSLFAGLRTIVQEEDHSGRESPTRGTFQALATQLPLVVLVDGATAGPGEVLAAAVQDYGLGTIVGTPTAGRLGTPRLIGLSDGSAAEITVRRMLSPSGKPLLGSGVTPDVIVADDPTALAAGDDVVRDRGLALLKE